MAYTHDGGMAANIYSESYAFNNAIYTLDRNGNAVSIMSLDSIDAAAMGKTEHFVDMTISDSGRCAMTGYTSVGYPMRHHDNMNFITIDSAGLVTGIDENLRAIGTLHLFPNPATSILHLESNIPDNGTIEIRDLSGRIIYAAKLISQQKDIDISSFSKGMYFLHYQDGKTVWNGKFVKG